MDLIPTFNALVIFFLLGLGADLSGVARIALWPVERADLPDLGGVVDLGEVLGEGFGVFVSDTRALEDGN